MAVSGNQASLIVQGKDRGGIVAAVAAVLAGHGASIVSLDQYSDDPQGGAFFQRTVFSVRDLAVRLPEIESSLSERLGQENGARRRRGTGGAVAGRAVAQRGPGHPARQAHDRLRLS